MSHKVKGPQEDEFFCTISRHGLTLSQQGLWSQIERFCRLSAAEARNAKVPPEDWEYGELYAGNGRLADACGCGISTVRRLLKKFVQMGLLIPLDVGYKVTTHQHYARLHGCPDYRFICIAGQRRVRPELRKPVPNFQSCDETLGTADEFDFEMPND